MMPVWFCLASGPSMAREDAEAIRGRGTVIAVNNQIENAPWADVHYACDPKWWRHYWRRLPEIAAFEGRRVGLKLAGDPLPEGVEGIEWDEGEGLGRQRVRTGSNGGYQAINYAFLHGARTIILLGYDMKPDGATIHGHTDHPAKLGNPNERMLAVWARKFRSLAHELRGEGVRVINCTRSTALECFERMPLRDAIALIENERSPA